MAADGWSRKSAVSRTLHLVQACHEPAEGQGEKVPGEPGVDAGAVEADAITA